MDVYTWVFPKIRVPQYPIKIDDLGVPLFVEPPTYI